MPLTPSFVVTIIRASDNLLGRVQMATSASGQAAIYQRPAELLQNLIRFNTTNPPGNEGECIAYINRLLNVAGIETTLLARDPTRPNLIAHLSGQGNAPPLLLYGHVDVVTAEN